MTSGAIIAGGQALRFGGRDKSRLVVEGQSIIVRQVGVMQHVVDEIFVVGGAGGPGRFADLALAVHADRIAGAGAMGGLVTALEVARGNRVLVVACDLPFLDAGLLRRIVERADGADAAWIRTPAGPEPLLACYQRHAAGVIRAEAAAGRLTLADLGRVLTVHELDLAEVARFGPPERLLANVNTPDDYARVQ